jgi:hypothetical protein
MKRDRTTPRRARGTAFERIDWSRGIAAALPHAGYGARDRHRDFRALFTATEQGKRVLAHILARCRLWEGSYSGGDTHHTAFREGQRSIAIWLMELIETEPEDATATAETERTNS